MRRWGTIAHIKITYPNQDNLDNRSVRCIFVGYPKVSKGYILYHSSIGLIESRDVEFLEHMNSKEVVNDQYGKEPIEFEYDDLTYDEEFIGNEPNLN